MTYLILANVSLILFFGIYLLVLKPLTFFQWNRVYLLTTVALSFALPLLQFIDLSQHKEVYQPLAVIDFVEWRGVTTDGVDLSHSWSVMDWGRVVYSIGVVLMLLWLGVRLRRVFTTLRANMTEHGSFSFFSRVLIVQEASHHDVVASHEQIHIKQGHSYDVLFLEAVRVFNWFNPIFYFYLKELKFQHECIADKACARDKTQYAELLVANAMTVSHRVLVHEFSNQSFLKQRIMMLFKNKSKKINRAKYVLVLPALLLVSGITLAFNASIKDVVEAKVERWQQTGITYADEGLAPLHEDEGVGKIFQQDTTKKSKTTVAKGKTTRKEKPELEENGTTVTDVTIAPQEVDTVRVFTAVEVNPEPKEGIRAFREWIGENYHYPQAAIDAGVKGQVVISFIVDADGQLNNFKIIKDLGHGTGEEAVKILKKAEAWRPGMLNGRNVRVAYTLPLRMNLQK